jgi:hypothetical protein
VTVTVTVNVIETESEIVTEMWKWTERENENERGREWIVSARGRRSGIVSATVTRGISEILSAHRGISPKWNSNRRTA